MAQMEDPDTDFLVDLFIKIRIGINPREFIPLAVLSLLYRRNQVL